MCRRNKRERSGTHAADGSRRDFDRPNTALIDAKFGVHRSMRETDGANCLHCAAMDCSLLFSGLTRRSNVNRFFEKWALERIGLIENGVELEIAVHEYSFHSDFSARNVLFDEGFARE